MDVDEIRRDFPSLELYTYLDNAATTQTPRPVVEEMNEYFFRYCGNYGRGSHLPGRMATEKFENARERLAEFIGAREDQIIFVKNTTEGINLIAQGLELKEGDHVIVTQLEHHSNFLPWMRLRKRGVRVSAVRPDTYGYVNPGEIETLIEDKTKLIACTHVSNVLGTVQPVEKIGKIAKRNDVLFLVDGAQSVGHMYVNVKKIGCDFMAISGHKGLLGPQGTGAIFIKDPDAVEPLILGGGGIKEVSVEDYILDDPPYRFEAGTPNIPGVIGLGRAVEYIRSIGLRNIERWEERLTKIMLEGLESIRGVEIYGRNQKGIVSFNISSLHPHEVSIMLDEIYRICVRSGHHCAMPLFRILGPEGSVRASVAIYNTEEEINRFIDSVEEISREMEVS